MGSQTDAFQKLANIPTTIGVTRRASSNLAVPVLEHTFLSSGRVREIPSWRHRRGTLRRNLYNSVPEGGWRVAFDAEEDHG